MRFIIPLLMFMGCEGDHMYVKAPSDMWVSPTMSDLGNVPVGSIQTQAFQLEVSIGTSVQLEGLTLENTSPDGTTHTYCKVMTELSAVSTDEPFYVDIEYAPLSSGYHRCVLTIESNAQTPEHVVELRGHAIEGSVARYPAMLDFGPVELGRNRARFRISWNSIDHGQSKPRPYERETDSIKFRPTDGKKPIRV